MTAHFRKVSLGGSSNLRHFPTFHDAMTPCLGLSRRLRVSLCSPHTASCVCYSTHRLPKMRQAGTATQEPAKTGHCASLCWEVSLAAHRQTNAGGICHDTPLVSRFGSFPWACFVKSTLNRKLKSPETPSLPGAFAPLTSQWAEVLPHG